MLVANVKGRQELCGMLLQLKAVAALVRPVIDYCHIRLLPLPPAVSPHCWTPGLL